MTTFSTPQITLTLTRMSANGFTVESGAYRSTLAYCVRDAVRTATLALGAPDAVISTIGHGLVSVVVQTPRLRSAELEGVLFLAARRYAQVNGMQLADVERVLKGV